MPRFHASTDNLNVQLISDDGRAVIDYRIQNFRINIDVAGLLAMLPALSEQVQSAITSEEVRQVLLEASAATKN